MPVPTGEAQAKSLASRLGLLFEVVLAMLQSRLGLVSLELREEFVHWTGAALLAALAFFLGQLGLLLLTLAVVALFPEHAALTLALCGGLYLAAAAACIVTLRQRLKVRPPPFSDSVAELKKDREWLSSLN
jgi:uncharacterized membrane protein YqjE